MSAATTFQHSTLPGVEIKGDFRPEFTQILSREALDFVVSLHRKFNPRRKELLKLRKERQAQIDKGEMPDFLLETRSIREGNWTVAPLPADLLDRRVEITGPVDRKMVINALNSGARVFMADFEDANSPTWENVVSGQINLRDAVNRTITFTDPLKGKLYTLNEKHATLLVRPRGWHLDEKHVWVDGAPISGSLFDFGLYFYHNAIKLLAKGSGPYFYLPKLESHLEARLWNDVFIYAQSKIGLPLGSIKATVLIETITAAFEMDEILYELRDHSAGLNCGRWDYIFSYIKRLSKNNRFLVPNRAQVTMKTPFMLAYSQLAIKTCHKREVHCMGGMAAYIPVRNDPEANKTAMRKVREDKEREARDGHDGTWVAHPGLVPLAIEVFDKYMPAPNQIDKKRDDIKVNARDLLSVPEGTITEEGVMLNIDVGIQYMEAWLRGTGCVPIYNLMEDAATAEISRTQLWQWVHHPGAKLEDGTRVSAEYIRKMIPVVLERIEKMVGAANFKGGKFMEAAGLLEKMIMNPKRQEFLTLKAYERLP
jgi:malate synthase